jgi:hypothetical protein
MVGGGVHSVHCLSIYGSTALCWTLATFWIYWSFYTVSRTPSTGDPPVARPLPAHTREHKQNKRTQKSMPQVWFEPMIPVLERAKTVHALDRAATVIGLVTFELVANWRQAFPQGAVLESRQRGSNAFCLQLDDENFCAVLTCSSRWTRMWRRASFVQNFGNRGETLFAEGTDKGRSVKLGVPDVLLYWLHGEDTSCSVTQEFLSILRTPYVHYRVHKSPPLVPYFSKTHS